MHTVDVGHHTFGGEFFGKSVITNDRLGWSVGQPRIYGSERPSEADGPDGVLVGLAVFGFLLGVNVYEQVMARLEIEAVTQLWYVGKSRAVKLDVASECAVGLYVDYGEFVIACKGAECAQLYVFTECAGVVAVDHTLDVYDAGSEERSNDGRMLAWDDELPGICYACRTGGLFAVEPQSEYVPGAFDEVYRLDRIGERRIEERITDVAFGRNAYCLVKFYTFGAGRIIAVAGDDVFKPRIIAHRAFVAFLGLDAEVHTGRVVRDGDALHSQHMWFTALEVGHVDYALSPQTYGDRDEHGECKQSGNMFFHGGLNEIGYSTPKLVKSFREEVGVRWFL